MSVPVAEDEPEPARGNVYGTLLHFPVFPLPALPLPLFPTISPLTPPLCHHLFTLGYEVVTPGHGVVTLGGRRARIRVRIAIIFTPRPSPRPGQPPLPGPIQSFMRSHSDGHSCLVDGPVDWVQKITDERTPGVGLSSRNQWKICGTILAVTFLFLLSLLLLGGLLEEIRGIIVDLSAEAVAAPRQDNGHATWAEEVLLRRLERDNYS